jgi:hypothetical protein
MEIVAGVGIDQHFESDALRRGCCGFMTVADAGEQEQGEEELLHGDGEIEH